MKIDMNIIKPVALKNGDKIGIAAPSMHIVDEKAVARGIKTLKELGFKIKIGPTVYSKYRNTTGIPVDRTKEIISFFNDPEIKAIICLIGGDTVAQLLRLIDYKIINKNPKIFSGMSDISHLHLAFLSKANIISLHGLDLTFGFGGLEDNPATKYNIDLFMKCCTQTEPLGTLPALTKWECWRAGNAQGRLVGGLLRAVINLYRTQYWPSCDKFILFWEAYNMQPHVIERELTILEADGCFDNVVGMIIGKLGNCEEREYKGLLPNIREIVLEITNHYNIPIIANADFGHDDTNMPMPEGILARMDAEKLLLELIEPMVL